MNFIETGPASAPTVVFLHGGGIGGWSWQQEIDRLPDYHLIAPDMPGQGQSVSDGPFTLEGAAAKVAEMIRTRAHGGKAHVAGLSLGSQTIIYLLAMAPEVVTSAFATGTLAQRLPGASLVRPMVALYNPIKNTPFMVRANMRSLGVPGEYYDQFAEDTRAATVDSFTAIFRANMGLQIPEGLGGVTAPVLLTVGEKEYGVMKSSAKTLAAAMPSAKAYSVAGMGHNWPISNPDLYSSTLRAWLSSAPLPPALRPL